jgi:HAD superfamily hydrolase (TIGR01490 family)
VSRLALFDMDRTLLVTETASLYVRYQREIGEASTRDLLRTLWWVAKYTFGVLDAAKVAEHALRDLGGTREEKMIARCEDWFARYVETHVTIEGRIRVAEHLSAGDTCAIVTGATLYTSRPLAKLLGISHVVASELEVDGEGRFTGRAVLPICLGEGKLERATRFANERGARLEDAIFYTDSVSDLPLLERVGEPVAVNPDPRLLRVAKQRRWRIETWRSVDGRGPA